MEEALLAMLIRLAVSCGGVEAEDDTVRAISRIAIPLPSMKERSIL
jgi:hypothetical protein